MHKFRLIRINLAQDADGAKGDDRRWRVLAKKAVSLKVISSLTKIRKQDLGKELRDIAFR